MKDTPSFRISAEDDNAIRAIVQRAHEVHKCNKLGLTMDLTACHANGNPLRLDDLLAAPPFDFHHDIMGIQGNLDRRTGKLMNCFLPRYSAPQP